MVFTYFQAICTLQLQRIKNKKKNFWGQSSRFCERLSASCRFKQVPILHFLRISPRMIDKASSHCQMAQSISFSLEEEGGRGLNQEFLSQCHQRSAARPRDFGEKTAKLYWLLFVGFFGVVSQSSVKVLFSQFNAFYSPCPAEWTHGRYFLFFEWRISVR